MHIEHRLWQPVVKARTKTQPPEHVGAHVVSLIQVDREDFPESSFAITPMHEVNSVN